MNDSIPKILIIDDDTFNSENICERLRRRNFEVHLLHDGLKYKECLEENDFDLILLDIVMPEISGLEILKEIRKKFQPIELPVIMETSRETAKDIVEALSLGANDYLPKPINIGIAEARIRAQIDLKKYYLESLDKKQLESITAMIGTYNHEINNPLTIAFGAVDAYSKSHDPESLERLKNSLVRIKDIVQKIQQLKKDSINLIDYSQNSKMVKIK